MSPMPSTMRLFQIAVHVWVLGFVASGLPVAEWLWLHPVSPEWVPPGPLRHLTHLFAMGLREEWVPLGLVVILVLSVVELIRAWRGHFGPAAKDHLGVEVPGIYWHFVDVMWIIVFASVYVL